MAIWPLLLLLLCASAGRAEDRPPVFVGVDEQRLVAMPGLRRFSLPCPGRVRGLRPPDQPEALLLRGIAPGSCDLVAWTQAGELRIPIQVVAWSHAPAPPALWRAAGGLEEVEVIPLGEGVLLRGTYTRLHEASIIAALVAEFAQKVRDETSPDPTLVAAGLDRLRRWAEFHPGVEVAREGSTLSVRGHPGVSARASEWERQARVLWPPVQVEWDLAGSRSTGVFLRAFLLEATESAARDLGVVWPDAVPVGIQTEPWKVLTPASVEAALHTLTHDGSLRVLSQPSLYLRVPGEAQLFSGGELPVRNHTRWQSKVDWRPHGLSLDIHATQAGPEGLRMTVSTEVSELDSAPPSAPDLPALKANRLKTEVDARYDEALLLSGLSRETQRSTRSGVAWLSDIPILGPLFGGDSESNEHNELLAVVIPHRTPPPAPPLDPLLEFPRGPVPVPRNWISPGEMMRLRESPDFPWSAFQ
ncbi:MAG TPA: hypothetical protein VL588_12405 [Bdellovibrionota bacterium]|nr:hypothetical protein [Bdellovibrionota bacterium]